MSKHPMQLGPFLFCFTEGQTISFANSWHCQITPLVWGIPFKDARQGGWHGALEWRASERKGLQGQSNALGIANQFIVDVVAPI